VKQIHIFLFCFVVFFLLPIIYIFFVGFTKSNLFELVSTAMSSLLLAFSATLLSFIFALPSAFIFVKNESKIIGFGILLFSIIPPFLLSIVFSNLFFHLGFAQSFMSLSFTHMITIFPYSFVFVVLGLGFVPKQATYYAKLYTSNFVKGFFLFYFPFMKSAFFVAFLLGISISFSQYILTLMLAKPGFNTLIIKMIPYLQSGDVKSASTYGTVFLLNTFIALYLFSRLKNVVSKN
jgi:putative spermidine/putrescine transport system permease protein